MGTLYLTVGMPIDQYVFEHKDEWHICYYRRPIPSMGGKHSVTCIDRMEFDEKCGIKPVVTAK